MRPAGGAAVSPGAGFSPPESASSVTFVDVFRFASVSRETCTPRLRSGSSLTVTVPWNRMTFPVSFSISRRSEECMPSVRTSVPAGRGSMAAAKTSPPDFATKDVREEIHGRSSRPGAACGPARSTAPDFGCQSMPSSEGVSLVAADSAKARAREAASRAASSRGASSCARAATAASRLTSADSTRRVPSWPAITKRPTHTKNAAKTTADMRSRYETTSRLPTRQRRPRRRARAALKKKTKPAKTHRAMPSPFQAL